MPDLSEIMNQSEETLREEVKFLREKVAEQAKALEELERRRATPYPDPEAA